MDFTSPPDSQASQLFLYSEERRSDALTGWATVRHVSSQTQVNLELLSVIMSVMMEEFLIVSFFQTLELVMLCLL